MKNRNHDTNLGEQQAQFRYVLEKMYEIWKELKIEIQVEKGIGWDKEAAQLSIIVPPMYNCLEQGLKILAKRYCENYNPKEDGHRLCKIFDRLNSSHKEKLESDYQEFLTLYGIDGNEFFSKVQDYLCHLDGNKGYENWKYLLQEANIVPAVSVEAMLTNLSSIVSLMESESWDNNRPYRYFSPIRDIGNYIIRVLCKVIGDPLVHPAVLTPDFYTKILNEISSLLFKEENRQDMNDETIIPGTEIVFPTKEFLDKLKLKLKKNTRPEIEVFVNRSRKEQLYITFDVKFNISTKQ